MAFATIWQSLRQRCEAVDPETVLVTPDTERAFTVESTGEDRIVLESVESGELRQLWRGQFEVLHDRLERDSDGISIADVPVGVEPYVSVLSLAPQYVVDESEKRLRRADEEERERDSPFLRPEWTTRTPPERVHDDAVLLADLLGRTDLDGPDALPVEELVNLYVLLSDVQRGSDRLRKEIGDHLLTYIGPDARIHGRFGTVRRTTRERRRLKDEETVLDALDEADIPHEWVLGVDQEKLDVVLAVTDLEEAAVYDVEQQVYAQKTTVEEAEKQSRLQGLRDRIAALETDDAEELRQDIDDLEDRLDSILAAG